VSDRRSSVELGNEMEPLALQLQAFTEPFHGDEPRPLVQQLVPLAGDIAASVAYVLKTSGDPAGTGRHNLTVLYGLATRLAEVAQAALGDEP
jgi:hypothetical protein